MYCNFCGKPLKDYQFNFDETMKSCPRCSVLDGEEHIYFPYPYMFGDTPARRSLNHPDGPQSYCVSHRSNPNREIPLGGIRCSELNK